MPTVKTKSTKVKAAAKKTLVAKKAAAKKAPAKKTVAKKAAAGAVLGAGRRGTELFAGRVFRPTPGSDLAKPRLVSKPVVVDMKAVRAVLLDAEAKPKDRLAAFAHVSASVNQSKQAFDAVCRVVGDKTADLQMRMQALSSLQATTFDPETINKYRATYLSVLRSLRDEDDTEVGRQAMGLLARERDTDTQAILLDGLKDPGKAKVAPEMALQLLSSDPKSGAYDVAKKIESDPPSVPARREALRVLAADGASVDLFERVLKDKTEPTEIRQIAASAMNHLAPQRMQHLARALAMDTSETEDARAVGLTALTHFGNASALSGDEQLQDQVKKIGAATTHEGLQSAVRSFQVRYS